MLICWEVILKLLEFQVPAPHYSKGEVCLYVWRGNKLKNRPLKVK